jgi:hypothetical protein
MQTFLRIKHDSTATAGASAAEYMAATEHKRVSNRIVTARLESAEMLTENQHRTASNTKLSLKMEGHDHGTTKKK